MTQGEETIYNDFENVCTKGVRPVALIPNEYNALITKKTFTNGRDDQPLFIRLYQNAFQQRLGVLRNIRLNSLAWGDSHAEKLAKVIGTRIFLNLHRIKLFANKLSGGGVCAIASSISTSTIPKLEVLLLGENPMGDDGARSLAVMLANGRTPKLRHLDIRKSEISDEGLCAVAEAITWHTTRALEMIVAKKNLVQSDCNQDGEPLVIQRALSSLRSERCNVP